MLHFSRTHFLQSTAESSKFLHPGAYLKSPWHFSVFWEHRSDEVLLNKNRNLSLQYQWSVWSRPGLFFFFFFFVIFSGCTQLVVYQSNSLLHVLKKPRMVSLAAGIQAKNSLQSISPKYAPLLSFQLSGNQRHDTKHRKRNLLSVRKAQVTHNSKLI